MPDRNSDSTYRFGFNGKENLDGVKGVRKLQDFEARIYDLRLGKWLSIDPKASKYPYISSYTAFGDNPIIYVDPGGETLRVAQTEQAKFIEDMTNIFEENAISMFVFDECGDLSYQNPENFVVKRNAT